MQEKIKKTVLITGATSGFGVHLTQMFTDAGFDVVANGRDKGKLSKLQDLISNTGVKLYSTVVADIQDQRGLDILKEILHTQKIDILINNAGINPELSCGEISSNIKDIDHILSVNTSAAISLSINAFEHFITQDGGIIININSMAGLKGSSREPLYSASKFGLRGFSEAVKDEWLKHGVRMTDVYSGAIATGMSSKRPDVNNLINPQELAELLVGLCKTESFFVREINVQRTKR